MSRWLDRRSVWQVFAIVWIAGTACCVIASFVYDDGHLGTATLKHFAFYWIFMAASVTTGVRLGTKARRDGKPGT